MSFFLPAFVAVWFGCGLSARAQDQPVGRVKNLTVPEFDSQNRRKAVLYGGEMVTGPSNVWEITGLKIESYAGGDQPAWIVEAPACSYHDPTKRAWSPGALKARSADGQLEITGEGFEWRQPDQLLVISNAVRTLLHPRGTNAAAAAAPSLARQDLELTAQRLNFDAQKLVAIYRGEVRARELLRPGATNPPVTLDCGQFSIYLGTNGGGVRVIEAEEKVVFTQGPTRAAGERAVYSASNDVITVTGQATWATDLAEGRGDTLVLDRKNETVQSLGNSHVRLHDTRTKPAAGTTNEVLELTAERLAARLPSTNQPQTRIQAEGGVVVNRGTQQAGGRQLVYTGTLTNGTAELTGNPWWRTPEAEGTADILTFDRTANAFRGRGHGQVKLARQPARTGEKPQVMNVQADEYDVSEEGALLRGNLVATDAQWEVRGAEMRLLNALGSRRLREVVVDQDVRVRQQAPPGSRQVPWQLDCRELRMFMDKDGSRIARITTGGGVRLEPERAPAAGETGLPWKLQCARADLSVGAAQQWESMVAQENVRLEPLPGQTNGFPWTMDCQQLSLFMAPGSTNQPERAIAEREVRLQEIPAAGDAKRAGDRWRLECDQAVVKFAAGRNQVESAEAEGNVRADQLQETTNGVASVWTMTSAAAALKMGASNRLEQISARRRVQIVQGATTNVAPVKVNCEEVVLDVGPSNTVQTVTAREGVVIEQGATRATGAQGIYRGATEDFELTGRPSLLYVEDKVRGTNAPRQLRIEGADVLIWNRISNQFRGRGLYRITPVGPLNVKTIKP